MSISLPLFIGHEQAKLFLLLANHCSIDIRLKFNQRPCSAPKFAIQELIEVCSKQTNNNLTTCHFKIQKLKQELSKSFAMKDLGPARQILGMQIVRDRKAKKLVLSQEKYIQKVFRRLSMDKTKPILYGYTDSNMAVMLILASLLQDTWLRGAVSWQSRLQKCVALSTREAELIAVVEACKELLWMKIFLGELCCAQERFYALLIQGSVQLSICTVNTICTKCKVYHKHDTFKRGSLIKLSSCKHYYEVFITTNLALVKGLHQSKLQLANIKSDH
uniref:Reverse transcriptase Ty1/copia-type domain-containing protein n=1 Tax=Solanum lycopersicum TaxID=4081 RepID=A0A3Q7HJ09_SOLLC